MFNMPAEAALVSTLTAIMSLLRTSYR
jgi:hypothetical protein